MNEDIIYRVRIEAYDPNTETSEVILSETEDIGYSGFVFLGAETDSNAMRSIVMALSTGDIAAMLRTEKVLTVAAHLAVLVDRMEIDKSVKGTSIIDLLKGEGGSSCPQ